MNIIANTIRDTDQIDGLVVLSASVQKFPCERIKVSLIDPTNGTQSVRYYGITEQVEVDIC